MSSPAKNIYGPNFRKATRLAISRSGGKCQFCGQRKAEEGHHWAWLDYPSDDEVQGHDITALCKVCHELATLLRDWVGRKHADVDQLSKEFKTSNNFYEKREAFSYWLFPEEDEETDYSHSSLGQSDFFSGQRFRLDGTSFPKSHLSVEDQLYDNQLQLDVMKDLRNSLERQMGRMERGESFYSPSAQEDAKYIAQETFLPHDASWHELEAEYKATGQQMGKLVGQMKSLRKGKKKGRKEFNTCGYYFSLLFFIFIAFVLATVLPKLGW